MLYKILPLSPCLCTQCVKGVLSVCPVTRLSWWCHSLSQMRVYESLLEHIGNTGEWTLHTGEGANQLVGAIQVRGSG